MSADAVLTLVVPLVLAIAVIALSRWFGRRARERQREIVEKSQQAFAEVSRNTGLTLLYGESHEDASGRPSPGMPSLSGSHGGFQVQISIEDDPAWVNGTFSGTFVTVQASRGARWPDLGPLDPAKRERRLGQGALARLEALETRAHWIDICDGKVRLLALGDQTFGIRWGSGFFYELLLDPNVLIALLDDAVGFAKELGDNGATG
jgi:hypothetical protein